MRGLKPMGWFVPALLAGSLLVPVGTFPTRAADPGKPTSLNLSADATKERLKENLFFLAAPESEGRGPLTKGLDRAADYIAAQFKSFGLKPLGKDGSYFQPFTTRGSNFDGVSTLEFQLPTGKTSAYVIGPRNKPADAGLLGITAAGKASGPVVFAGYGISPAQPKEGAYDDYAGLNVENKVVLVLRDAPRANREDDGFGTPNARRAAARLTEKIGTAQKLKAAAIIFVNDRVSAKDTDTLMDFSHLATNPFASKIPVLQVSRKVASQLLADGGGGSLEQREEAIDKDLKPQSVELKGISAAVDAKVKRGPTAIPLKNVVGVLEGSGPLADEAIVIGSHYDHVGSGGFGSLGGDQRAILTHFGADDNASGTTAMLELARRYSSMKGRQGRKMIFMAFSGEELGLFGSVHYCKEPLYPLEKTAAMVNLDMVGRLRPDKESKKDRLLVQGSGTAETFEALLDKINKTYEFTTVRQKSGNGPSDHSSFSNKKVPVLFFWTDVHEDYHRPTDTPDRINYAGMEKIIRFSSEVIDELATVSPRPKHVEVRVASSGTARRSGPTLGIMPDYSEENNGVKLEGVAAGKPAQKAGLKGGDRIVKIGDKEVKNLETYMEIMATKKAGETLKIGIIREGKSMVIEAKLE